MQNPKKTEYFIFIARVVQFCSFSKNLAKLNCEVSVAYSESFRATKTPEYEISSFVSDFEAKSIIQVFGRKFKTKQK